MIKKQTYTNNSSLFYDVLQSVSQNLINDAKINNTIVIKSVTDK